MEEEIRGERACGILYMEGAEGAEMVGARGEGGICAGGEEGVDRPAAIFGICERPWTRTQQYIDVIYHSLGGYLTISEDTLSLALEAEMQKLHLAMSMQAPTGQQ